MRYQIAAALLQGAAVVAQMIYPSNNTDDLLPVDQSPRFMLNGTEFQDLPPIRLAPLGPYAQISPRGFVNTNDDGKLIKIDAANANNVFQRSLNYYFYISCDAQDYTDGNLRADDVFTIAINNNAVHTIILYSTIANHCVATSLDQMPEIWSVMTTTDMNVAQMLADMDLLPSSMTSVTLLPDLNSYTNTTAGPGMGGGFSWANKSPTTAVAMIILYSITGLITALFITIIVTGAIRAHRHPERYGPRTIIGRGRQSRAKGIARAMLDTIPIVKFGDRSEGGGAAGTAQKPPSLAGTQEADIEMANATKDIANNDSTMMEDSTSKSAAAAAGATEVLPTPIDEPSKEPPKSSGSAETPTPAIAPTTSTPPPPTSAPSNPSCSICTEDFTPDSDVRVLPCNHQFHPECVDPWLLNVSGTCPLCRIDLRPPTAEPTDAERNASVTTEDGLQTTAPERRPSASLAGGYRPGEDFLMAGSLRSGRSRTSRQYSSFQNSAFGSAAGAGGGEGNPFAGLRRAFGGSREERVAALRRFRAQQGDTPVAGTAEGGAGGVVAGGQNEESRQGLARRLRERLRVRTERLGATSNTGFVPTPAAPANGTAASELSLGQVRSREHIDGRAV